MLVRGCSAACHRSCSHVVAAAAALAEFFVPRVTCMLECEQAPANDTLSYPPYRIANSGYEEGRNANLSAKIISPTAREQQQTAMRPCGWICIVCIASLSYVCLWQVWHKLISYRSKEC
jgi:hypothetical protein